MLDARFATALAVLVALVAVPFAARAAQLNVAIVGSLGSSENSCTQIIPFFTLAGCTYGNDSVASGGWVGPEMSGAHYGIGTAGDSVNHVLAPGDGRTSPALTGTVTIDDHGTPGDGSDDVIGAELVIGPTARNVYSGQARQVVERWTAMTHTMNPATVNAATGNALGGFDYVIGLHGFPQQICSASDSADCFASENAPLESPHCQGSGRDTSRTASVSSAMPSRAAISAQPPQQSSRITAARSKPSAATVQPARSSGVRARTPVSTICC